jgi:CPA2 family monovalent cation:H+ antiporter-2
MTGYFIQAFIYLVAAVIAVPLAKRFGLGSVLGYLVAGVVIGPILGLVGQETTTIQHFAEFGVVMMLFLVGMELDPKGLWAMRVRLIGLGGLQVVLTAAAGSAIGWWLGLVWQTALAVGLIFALSSTAIVLQTLNEKGLARTEGGRSAFSVLLFQDIAVIPMLALIPLLALPELRGAVGDDGHANLSLVAHLPGWAHALVVVAAIASVIAAGYYLMPLLFRYVIGSGLREVFTATALMLVIGIAALMSVVNLSPALGAFLAGVVLANSEFKHELEANIEPFKGLLLGLFFITVGAGINFSVLAAEWATVLSLGMAVIVVKGVILLGLALLFRVHGSNGWLFTLSLAQAGEFGFVLLTYSVQNSVIPTDISQILSLVVALSMFLTPLLFIAYDRLLVLPRYQTAKNDEREADMIDEQAPVIVAGVGRFGQIICRLLRANNIPIVALDHEIEQIENLRKINIKSYFGDASRSDLLETAGIEHARLLVIALDDRERAVQMVKHVKHAYPQVWVLARAFDRGHGYQLRDAGADDVISETYHSALELGGHALTAMGVHPVRARQMTWAFMQKEDAHEDELFDAWKEIEEGISFSPRYGELFMKLEESLNSVMQQDWPEPQREDVPIWTPPNQNRDSD